GDIIMVHSSLSAFGFVDGGSDAIIDALMETVGDQGTIVMPISLANRKRLPDGKYEVLDFDPETAEIWTGTIPKTFIKRKNVIKNFQGSIAATGRHAQQLIRSLNRLLYYDKSYVLLLGVSLKVNSAMHLSENIAVPPQFIERLKNGGISKKQLLFWMIVRKAGYFFGAYPKIFFILYNIGKRIKDFRKVPSRNKETALNYSPFGPWANFAKMEQCYKNSMIMKETIIGEASCKLIKVRPMVKLFTKALQNNPSEFYQYRPSTYEEFLDKKQGK
ncbi:MAG: AAC(3) family N-acetyltransferase, partial [Thermoplasmatales archaeon]|nr:AAC(3) family N-acetyltransferase [Thermoplasmatales archaeon]